MRTLTLGDLPAGHVCTFAHWQYPARADEPEIHDHDFHELFWVEEGEGFSITNGERRPLAPGLLVLVRADDAHGFSPLREGRPVRFANFAFPRALWDAVRRRHFADRDTLFALPGHRDREWRLDPAALARVRSLAADLAAGHCGPLQAEAFLLGVLALLDALDQRRVADAMPPWLADAVARVREPRHFVEGAPALARLAGKSPEHVARAVRRHLGKTPTDLVNEARLDHATRQLCTTSRPVADIVADCGLGNVGHFYKLFRARHGASPERYRLHAYTESR